jgi:hypothetical protein
MELGLAVLLASVCPARALRAQGCRECENHHTTRGDMAIARTFPRTGRGAPRFEHDLRAVTRTRPPE